MIDRLFALEYIGIKLGLENIRQLCAALDHPERRFLPVHIAGTNGKGSVTAMVHTALLRAGITAARYTSPHLSDIRERFVIGDEPVSQAALESAGRHVLDCADRLVSTGQLPAPPTFFEATTAIAFELFRRASVEVAVVEVGLGGRFDATNVVDAPIGAITSIGFDHQQYLGNTLERIAFEKAGIIKPGMTLVTGRLPAEAATAISDVAAQRGARVLSCDDDTRVEQQSDAGVTEVEMTTPDGHYGPVPLALRGEHQVGNAMVAVRVLERLRDRGLTIPASAIERGLSETIWPARLELVELRDGRRMLIDAAHNPEGAAALASYLSRWYPGRLPLVVGVMRDKDATRILDALLPVCGPVVCTAAPTPRAMPADALAGEVRRLAPERLVDVVMPPAEAVQQAFRHGNTVCVAGSIFLAGAVRDALKGHAILP